MNRAGAASLSPTPLLHPPAGNRDPGSGTRYTTGLTTAARTGRLRHYPFTGVRSGAAVIPQKAESSSRIAGNRVPIQKNGNNRITAIGKKRGKPPRMPRIGSAANTASELQSKGTSPAATGVLRGAGTMLRASRSPWRTGTSGNQLLPKAGRGRTRI